MFNSALIKIAALVLIGAVSLTGASASTAADLRTLVTVAPDFSFESEQSLWVDLTVTDIDGAPADLRSVEILAAFDAAGTSVKLLERGVTDVSGGYQRQIRVPTTVKYLTIRVGVLGIDNTRTLAISGDDLIAHHFE